MPTAITDTAELEKLIQPEKLAEQGLPKPKRVAIAAARDHTGDDAYYVYLIFPNSTPDSAFAWRRIKPLVNWVHDTIWKANGERHWPYITVKR